MSNANTYSKINVPDAYRDVDAQILTQWLPTNGKCGPTGYKDIITNVGWCKAEVDRLYAKGIMATVVNHQGNVAVVKVKPTDTIEETQKMVMEMMDHIYSDKQSKNSDKKGNADEESDKEAAVKKNDNGEKNDDENK